MLISLCVTHPYQKKLGAQSVTKCKLKEGKNCRWNGNEMYKKEERIKMNEPGNYLKTEQARDAVLPTKLTSLKARVLCHIVIPVNTPRKLG
jgi:hypothetical protein